MAKPKPTPPWTPRRLREQLGMDVREWARVLGVAARTAERWEADDVAPQGLPSEVFRGIASALDAGVPGAELGRTLSLGLGAYLHQSLLRARKPAS